MKVTYKLNYLNVDISSAVITSVVSSGPIFLLEIVCHKATYRWQFQASLHIHITHDKHKILHI